MANQSIDTTRLQRISRAYTETAVMWAALDLELFTAVANGATDEASIAQELGISELDAERLVVSCLTLDLLREADGQLSNPPDVARYLVKGEHSYAGPWMTFTRRDVPKWFDIANLMASSDNPSLLGMYTDMTVESARKYHRATYSVGMGAGRRFARQVDLSGRSRMLDIGGGSGAYSINVVKSYPDMTAVVFDLPPVAVVAAEFIRDNNMAERVEAIGGDFTADPFPVDCDVAVMASNLPIYNAAVIGSVIAKAHDALLPGAEMHLIGEMLDDDRRAPADAAMWGMNELLAGGLGRAHTVSECIGYFEEAQFHQVEISEFIPGVLQRVSGTKATA